MKKPMIMILAIALMLIMTACEGNVAQESMEQANLAIEDRDYNRALSYLEVALDKKGNNEVMSIVQQ